MLCSGLGHSGQVISPLLPPQPAGTGECIGTQFTSWLEGRATAHRGEKLWLTADCRKTVYA